jgi:hypothetical protein
MRLRHSAKARRNGARMCRGGIVRLTRFGRRQQAGDDGGTRQPPGRTRGEGRGVHHKVLVVRSPSETATAGDPLHAQERELAENKVELEIGVLRGQCLDRRISDRKKLIKSPPG